MKKTRAKKLSLTRDTLHAMGGAIANGGPDDSCVQSCYLVSCGGSCAISTAQKVECFELQQAQPRNA